MDVRNMEYISGEKGKGIHNEEDRKGQESGSIIKKHHIIPMDIIVKAGVRGS